MPRTSTDWVLVLAGTGLVLWMLFAFAAAWVLGG